MCIFFLAFVNKKKNIQNYIHLLTLKKSAIFAVLFSIKQDS